MPRYIPKTIEQEGLEKHIDKHTKLGFKVFEESILRGVNISNLRRLFDGKGYPTIKRWIQVYAKLNPDHAAKLISTYNLENTNKE